NAYTSDQATIWRWRNAFQHDFAARMEWTISDRNHANHNPDIVVNGKPGRAPLAIDATIGEPLTLDAGGTRDPDGDTLKYFWFFYPEAGSGMPGQPVAIRGGPRQSGPRVTLDGESTPRVTVTPRVAGTAHIILAVEDNGQPSLTSYRRIILTIKPKGV